MQIVVDNMLLNYEVSGSGELILLLHGWADAAKGLGALHAELSKTNKVLALDLPGFGGSQPPGEAWNLDDYAAFVRHALDKLKLGQPYAIIGHSNGGALAIRAVSLKLLQPQKLILLAASGVRNTGKARRAALNAAAKTGKAATFWLPGDKQRQLRKKLYGAAGSDALVVPELEETFKRTVRQDVQKDAAKLMLPTLLIYASGDPAVPLSIGETYHAHIRDSRLEVLDSDDHFVHLDRPAEVAALIKEFLDA